MRERLRGDLVKRISKKMTLGEAMTEARRQAEISRQPRYVNQTSTGSMNVVDHLPLVLIATVYPSRTV